MHENTYAGRPRGAASVKVKQVVEVVISRGRGTEQDMCRPVTQYWSFEGQLLAEFDPVLDSPEIAGQPAFSEQLSGFDHTGVGFHGA